jgi:tetratricopeptide (TPR) repeat protein
MSGPSLTVHPEHVSLCFLITAVVAPPPLETGWGSGFDGPTVQRLLALFLLEEIQDCTTPTLTPLPLLVQRLQQQLGAAGTVLASVLLSCLCGIQSPDDLVSLTARFASFLAPAGTTPTEATDASSIVYISTSSPLGLFLRRVRLGLGNMSLQGLAALAAAVQKQVQDGITLFEQQQEDSTPAQQDVTASAAASEGSSSSGTGALKDPAVLDAYFNTLLAAVSSLGPCLPAATVQAAAAPLAALQDNSSKLQYLDLAISLAHKDMNAALAALHQYFDCNGSSSGNTPGGSSSSKPRGQHQSALHNLAALQVSLGYPQEALAALQELLRLGQQQGDEWSLLHGLASLCRVMGVSEGLQDSGSQHSRGAGSSGSNGSSAGGVAGWGLLDLRRTEQQLQLQALLQRCLDSARDMHVPHIAAYAAIALCRFRLTHASSSSGGSAEAVTAVPGLSGDSSITAQGAAAAATAAGTSLTVQRMLLDVATLEHQTALAAAAPHAPATAGAAVRMEASQAPMPGPVMWASELYNPTQVFGTGTSTAAPGVNVLAGAVSARTQAAGSGWRSSSAAVSQALATGNVLAAAALQLQGAPVLAGVRALMALTGPGGAGVHDPAIAAAIPAAANAAAAGGAGIGTADSTSTSTGHAATCSTSKEGAAGGGGATGKGLSAAALTGSSVSVDDLAAGWVQLVQVALEVQGVAAAQHVLTLAESHFPRESPQALAVVREVVRLRAALNAGQHTDARLACEELQGLAPAAPQLGLEVRLVAAEAHVQLLQASGCFAEAHAAAASLFATAAGAGMQPQAVAALLMMAKACIAAGDAAGGLPYALSALLHCQVLQFDSLLPEAVLQVATAWQSLAPEGAQFVLQLLQQVLPMAHAEGGPKVRGELEEAIARLQLALDQAAAADASQHSTAQQGAAGGVAGEGLAGSRVQKDSSCVQKVRQRLSAAAAMLEQAGEANSAARCWLLLAHVCNAAGLEADRDEAAVHWQLCKQQCAA